MSTVNQIVSALKAKLETLPGVDASSSDVYLPPVESQSIALIIPPFGQETRVEALSARRGQLMQSHRIRCEFWVKINTGDLATTLARAREIGLLACRALIADQSLGEKVSRVGFYGHGSEGPRVDVEVTDRPVQIAQAPYIVVTVIIGVIDYSDA